MALVRQGKDALQALRQTTELMPEDGEAHRNLGAALYDRGQWAAALTSLAAGPGPRSLRRSSTLVDAANAMRQLGRPAEAIPIYQRALQLNPQEVEAQNNLGNAYLELQQYQNAKRWYQRALEIKPGDAQILCNLGSAQAALRTARRGGDQLPSGAGAKTPLLWMHLMGWAMCCGTWGTAARRPPSFAAPSSLIRDAPTATATWERRCLRSTASMRRWRVSTRRWR